MLKYSAAHKEIKITECKTRQEIIDKITNQINTIEIDSSENIELSFLGYFLIWSKPDNSEIEKNKIECLKLAEKIPCQGLSCDEKDLIKIADNIYKYVKSV